MSKPLHLVYETIMTVRKYHKPLRRVSVVLLPDRIELRGGEDAFFADITDREARMNSRNMEGTHNLIMGTLGRLIAEMDWSETLTELQAASDDPMLAMSCFTTFRDGRIHALTHAGWI